VGGNNRLDLLSCLSTISRIF